MTRSTTLSMIALITLLLITFAMPVGASEDATLLENESMIERLVNDFITSGDTSAAETILNQTFVAHDPLNGDMDRDTFIEFYAAVEAAMPEYVLMSGGQMVALQILNVENPPTMLDTNHFTFGPNGMLDTLWSFFYIADGQIVEAWLIYDELSLWQFVGEPGSPGGEPNNRGGIQSFQ